MSIELPTKEYIARHSLLADDALHIVALSGGADSVALLRVLLALGYRVEAAHCNFHLRGAESDRDEDFCLRLCEKLGVPLHRIHFDTTGYAKLHKVGIELAARELRYRWFEQLRRDIGAEDICVAHHKDDNAETVVFRLIRGTGLRGLAGIRPQNGHIKRPLLCVGRKDIVEYLHSLGQDWIEDSTNKEREATRNRIRLDIAPQLAAINPAYAESIAKTSDYVAAATAIFDKAVAEARQRIAKPTARGIAIDIGALLAEVSPEYILHEILAPYGFTPAQTEDIYIMCKAPATGRTFASATHQLLCDRGRLLVEPVQQPIEPLRMPMEGNYLLSDGRHIRIAIKEKGEGYAIPKEPWHIALDAGKTAFPLTLRPTQPADRMNPFGMRGTKLISDILTDRKATVFDKRRQLVLHDAQGRILWLAGVRTADFCKVGAGTSKVVEITIL